MKATGLPLYNSRESVRGAGVTELILPAVQSLAAKRPVIKMHKPH